MFKTQTVLLGMAMILSAAAAQGQGSALDAHRRALAGALEDGSMSPFETRQLAAMTPEQAEAFAAGEDPAAIVLESGETLASFIADLLADGQGLVYVPLDSCLVLRTVDSVAGMMTADETRSFLVRGVATDFSEQGGLATGCLVPTEAVAVAMHFRVRATAAGVVGRLQASRTAGPGPPNRAMEYLRQGAEGHAGLAIIGLCGDTCVSGDFDLRTTGVGVNVRGDVIGFFRPIEAGDLPGGISGGDADTLDGLDSTDFALVSHTHDSGDITSGTVGEPFIDPAITRDSEVVDIVKANDGSGSGIDADLLDGRDSLDLMPQVEDCLTVSPSCPSDVTEALAARCWQTIQAAINAAETTCSSNCLPTPAGPTNPYVINVGPGIYDEEVRMLTYVHIEGSGQKVTTITSSTSPTVRANADSELRQLTVENHVGGTAIFSDGYSPTIRHVTARATGRGAAVEHRFSGRPVMIHLTAESDGVGIKNDSNRITIRDSVVIGAVNAIENSGPFPSASIVNTQIVGGAVDIASGITYACVGAYDGTFTELDANCQSPAPAP